MKHTDGVCFSRIVLLLDFWLHISIKISQFIKPKSKSKVSRVWTKFKVTSLKSQGFRLWLTTHPPNPNSKFHCKAVFSIEIEHVSFQVVYDLSQVVSIVELMSKSKFSSLKFSNSNCKAWFKSYDSRVS